MIRSKKAMGILWAWLTLALHLWPGIVAPAHAQGTRKDDIVFNSRGVPLAGATVRVCAQPATGQPCTPLALIYSDAALTQALANPTTTDGLGNYHFYAASGKYEIEISGPGITTKQLPDITLPSDPASPSFTGAVSAFSLNLSGNLSVNGNTTVVGSLASGTLSLNNQAAGATPPSGTVNLYSKTADKRLYYKDDTGTEVGPISTGGGGGAAPAAPTNALQKYASPTTFAASGISDDGTTAQIPRDTHIKGPNPTYDTQQWGGYIGGYPNAPATTGNISSGSATLTTPSAFDVNNGQYVTVYGAGPTTTMPPPNGPDPIVSISVTANVASVVTTQYVYWNTGQNLTIAGSSDSAFNGTFANTAAWGGSPTFAITHANCSPCTIGGSATLSAPIQITPQGVINGATTYNYKLVSEDLYGGLSAASIAATITNAAAVLGVNTLTIPSGGCARDGNGVATITTTAAHNIQPGVIINLQRFTTGDGSFEGQFTVAATPTSTTFTFNQYGSSAKVGACTGGTVKVVAKNILQWNDNIYPGTTGFASPIAPKGVWIYRCQGTGCTGYTLIGHADGVDGGFVDYGLSSPPTAPAYVPTGLPPASPTNQWLSAKVSSGAGTNTLTLSANASNTVSSAAVLHDNTPVIYAICAAMPGGMSGQGGTIYIPDGAGGAVFPITTTLDMVSNCPGNVEIDLAARLSLQQPVIPNGSFMLKGLAQGGQPSSNGPFAANYQAQVIGSAYPLIYDRGDKSRTQQFINLNFNCYGAYQSCYMQDDTFAGGYAVKWQNVAFQGSPGSTVFKIGGAFHYYWDQVSFGNNAVAPTNWGVPEPFISTLPFGIGLSAQTGSLVFTSISELHEATFTGGGMVFDSQQENATSPQFIKMFNVLCESCQTPLIRTAFLNSTTKFSGFFIENLEYADFVGGQATPLVDFASTTQVTTVEFVHPSCSNGNQPLIAGVPGGYGGIQITPGMSTNGCNNIGTPTYTVPGAGQFFNSNVIAYGTGAVEYGMNTPAAPTVAISGASGPAANTYYYSIVAKDVNLNFTIVSPASAPITVNGTQGVLVTWTPVPGQLYTTICRGTSSISNNHFCANAANGFNISGASFVDNGSYFPAASPPVVTTAASSSLGANGLNTQQMVITSGGFAATMAPPASGFTANHNMPLPDVTGYQEISSYVNTAYDNSTRANGAIGANWSVQQNGLNISSNNIQGTAAGSNTAFWSANPFSTSQFAQATITALNGTTDFPGVTTLGSGSGATSTYYDCVENASNIFIQRVLNSASTNLASTASTGTAGDILRLEYAPGGALTCYKNGVSTLTASDTQITAGAPGVIIAGAVATEKNWSGGNLHPLNQLDIEADYTKVQHLNAGIGIGAETFTASPRAEQNVFLPGALTSTWTAATWTTDKAVTVTRVQVQAKTAPAGCTTSAIVRVTDGTTPINVTIAGAANDSGAITQNYAAGSALQILVQTASAGCTTSPADANVVVQYRMQ